MLFSSAAIAEFINNTFEPVWVSVRPVPIITIDFGNGHKITRTLHGNIATSVCDVEGRILDILPGIYTPTEYQRQLEQFRLLHVYFSARDVTQRASMFREYHQRLAERLKADQPPDVLVSDPRADRIKLRVEDPVKLLAGSEAPKPATGQGNAPGVAGWKELAEDTQINEAQRRRQIHEKLATVGSVKPDALLKWLYKEVLHADLDDPLLGLGSVLNQNYPFAQEEQPVAAP